MTDIVSAPTPLQAQVTDAMRRLSDLTMAADQVRAEVARYWGLTISEIQALTVIDRLGAVSQREVAEALGITPSAVTVMVDRLAVRGFVVKSPHPTDRRRVQIRPAMVDDGSLPVSPDAMVAAAFVEMDEEERLEATALMGRLTDILSAAAARVHDLEPAAPPRRRT